MEIYKDLSSPDTKKFEELLNSQLSKNKIEEGKVIEGKITKITEKFDMPETFMAIISSVFLIFKKNQIPDSKIINGNIL